MAGAEANRIDLTARVMFARARERQGKAGPTLGASADLAMIARTVSQSRRVVSLPVIGGQALGKPCRPIDTRRVAMSRKRGFNALMRDSTTPNG
ncbi:MAG TPA: hypothetical protein VIJ96_11395 [Acidothermaceae bacterium]